MDVSRRAFAVGPVTQLYFLGEVNVVVFGLFSGGFFLFALNIFSNHWLFVLCCMSLRNFLMATERFKLI